MSASGGASRSGLTKTNRAPGVDLDRAQAESVAREVRLALGPRRGAERAVEPVRPRVVGALERLAPPGPADDRVAAVPADVDEGVQVAVAAAGDDDRDVAGGRGEVRAALGHLAGVVGVLPRATEDPFLLEPEDLCVGVPRPGEGRRPRRHRLHGR